MQPELRKKERKARLLLSQSKYSTQYNYVLTIQHRYLAAAAVALSRQQFYTAWSVKSVQKLFKVQTLQIICRMLLYAILLFGSFMITKIFSVCFQLDLYTFECPCSAQIIDRYFYYLSRVGKNCYLYFYSQLHCCKTYTVYLFIDQYIL